MCCCYLSGSGEWVSAVREVLGAEAEWGSVRVLLYHEAAKNQKIRKERCAEEIRQFM